MSYPAGAPGWSTDAGPRGPSSRVTPAADASAVDASVVDADAAVVDAPVVDATVVDAPVVDAAEGDAPVVDRSAVDRSAVDPSALDSTTQDGREDVVDAGSELPATGDRQVDEAVEALLGVLQRPLADQVEVYAEVHGRLQDRLADLDG